MPYSKDSAVLIGLRGICFMGIHLMDMHLAGGTAQKVGTHEQIASISVSNAEQ